MICEHKQAGFGNMSEMNIMYVGGGSTSIRIYKYKILFFPRWKVIQRKSSFKYVSFALLQDYNSTQRLECSGCRKGELLFTSIPR